MIPATEKLSFKAHYDVEAENYDDRRDNSNSLTKYNQELQREWIYESLKNSSNILECGCGTGKFTLDLAAKSVSIKAIDYSLEMIGVLHTKASKLGLEIDVKEASIDALPYGDESHDGVFSIAVIRHFEDQRPALKEMIRVLETGGLLVTDFLNQSYFKPYRFLRGLLGLNPDEKSEHFFKNYYYTESEFCEQLEKLGMEVMSVKYFVQIPPKNSLVFLKPFIKLLNKFLNFGGVGFVLAKKR